MTLQTYVKNDLEEYLDEPSDEYREMAADVEHSEDSNQQVLALLLENDPEDELWRYRRTTALEAVLPDEAEIHSAASGDYQGEMVHVIELAGYIWMAHDYYGSCSYCDGFIDNTVGWTTSQVRRFYCFEEPSDAIEYVGSTDDWGYEATELKPEAKRILTEEINDE